MLFDSERHEPLLAIAWDESQARQAIQSIVDDIERARGSNGNWPVHPLDAEGDEFASGFKGLYLGSAGLLWALWYLQREGAADLALDPTVSIERGMAAYQADP